MSYETNEEYPEDKVVKEASKKHIKPCPKCKQGFPVVQALWDNKELILCCTHCGIRGKVRTA